MSGRTARHRSPARLGLLGLTTAALLAGGLGVLAGGPAQAAPERAQVWLTTPDGAQRLADQDELAFDGQPAALDIRVDAGQRHQEFSGAGASVTEASAGLVQALPAGDRDALLDALFTRDGDGIGLNYLRQPLGSTDFNTGDFYTYEDVPGQFGIDRDRELIIPVLHDALDRNPELRLMGSPWSPPAWMKSEQSLNGGSLLPEHYQDYADYLVAAVQAYQAEGIELTDLTVQNEPLFATSYPSTAMSADEQAAFLRVLDATLTEAGLPTTLFTYDHNWDEPGYPLQVLAATADLDRVAGAAFHCYGGSPEAQGELVAAGARVFFTECSGTDSEDGSRTFADTLRWQAENLVVRNMRHGGETVITWNLALDDRGGPHQGHCDTRCNGVVEIAGTQVTRNAEFYVLGHLTKFLDPGARRLESTSEGPGGLQNVVFENPDGGRVAYVVNASDTERAFSLTEDDRSLHHTLPPGAVATYTWTN
ncbi:glycoside hydrolase family 30 beta sandwich domain-containing protein [Streptomyces sp. DSM 44915]|uniref:Glycoside hydrolase family 30 beta sandwich domain-containing protein n=1 Tax=Streptomyces chisholmiae TaxID=3075540 RepID=A0ABU2JMG2_9ACTN|nr:glycoside hydrolase family 30 beta sandwich domain-containing protein [Streptomyces sp. DSM 44915]MDT0265714.1 glycoside hydrolase family 30 beta sandwich domain-containing protein [Streptomyces sp. DSM 44915]